MKRRLFVVGMGVGAITLADASTGAKAVSDRLIDVPVIDGNTGPCRGSKSCRIIGVGGAGCNLLAAMRTSGVQGCDGLFTDLIAVDLCPETLSYVEVTNKAMPERAPTRTMPIAQFGSGGEVNAARAAALRHRDALNEFVNGADVVVLIAGLGGGTGSGVTPIMARMARTAGAMTVVMAVTPFDFEGARDQTSDTAIKYLNRDADLVLCFSNQALGDELGDDATLDDVFATQQRRIATWLRAFLVESNRRG